MTGLKLPDQVRIGAFFLETLTTGMYEDPFHCVREYVQNAFDAIRDARAADQLPVDGGRITVAITRKAGRASLSIRDDGTGIPTAEVTDRLISLGSSTKRPMQHAGFRGIGRLAGIAYCTTLRFTTTAATETTASVVEFDCGRLRGDMQPGARPQPVSDVLKRAITLKELPVKAADHYTLVEMETLVNEGEQFVEDGGEKLLAYLKEHSPVDYANEFSFATKVKQHLGQSGIALPIVEVELKHGRERTAVLKPYRDVYGAPEEAETKRSKLTGIMPVGMKEHGWSGWIGQSNFPGEIQDETVAGLRFRMKNIQIGDEGIIERIMGTLSAKSDRRLARWMVGEIFIDNPKVVPNARRDGFEEGADWQKIKSDLLAITGNVAKTIRNTSTRRNRLIKIDKALVETKGKITNFKGSATKNAKLEIEDELKAQLAAIDKALKGGSDPKRTSQLISTVKELQESLQKVQVVTPDDREISLKAAVSAARTVLRAELDSQPAILIGDKIEEELKKLP